MHSSNRILAIGVAIFLSGAAAHAQQRVVALKNGESTDLGPVYFIAQCRSILVGHPEIEVLEGLPELTLSIREEMVLPRAHNCANKVPGGTLVLTAKDVTEHKEARITYRVKYKTKDGDRQRSVILNVSLFP
jgi:hypothetical protein